MALRLLLLSLTILFTLACSDPEVEVPKLVKELSSSDSNVRVQAAMNLGSYGEDAAQAVPALKRSLYDQNGGVRSAVAFALRKIGTPEAQKALDAYKKK